MTRNSKNEERLARGEVCRMLQGDIYIVFRPICLIHAENDVITESTCSFYGPVNGPSRHYLEHTFPHYKEPCKSTMFVVVFMLGWGKITMIING